MQTGWTIKKLKQVGKCIPGLTYSPSDVVENNGLLVLRSSNIKNGKLVFDDNVYVNLTVQKALLTRDGDILVCVRNGSRSLIGKSALISGAGTGVAHGAFMMLFRSNDYAFVYQLFQSALYYRQVRRNLGATINSINSSDFYKFQFSFPPEDEQLKIAALLSTWDTAIEKTEMLIEAKKRRHTALSRLLLNRNDQEVSLRKFIKHVMREVPRPDKPYWAIGIRSHGKGTFRRFIEKPDDVAMNTLYQVRHDDLIVNITFAWEGAIALVDNVDEDCLVSHRFPTFEIDKKKALPEYLRHVIVQQRFIRYLGMISPGGAGRNRVLNKKDFLDLKLSLPDIKEQQHIGDILNTSLREITLLQTKLDLLKKQKTVLMQKLLTGEWRVKAFMEKC